MSNPYTIPAKRTRYKGKWYRSKTEALWAVELDKLKQTVEYETSVDGVYYLPDFLVGGHTYVEVKPNLGDGQIPHKWMMKVGKLVMLTSKSTLMVFGEPSESVKVLHVSLDSDARVTLDIGRVKGLSGVRNYLQENA